MHPNGFSVNRDFIETMALAFSSSDRAVIEQAVNVTQDTNRRAADLEAVYEMERCASWINDHGYQTVNNIDWKCSLVSSTLHLTPPHIF